MKHQFFFKLLIFVAALSGAAAYGQSFKINAGGPASGSFSADTGFVSGTSFLSWEPVSGATAAPANVYQSERYGNFTYNFSGLGANKPVEVKLHFAEIYWAASGKRLFNVKVNGSQVLTNYDIFAKVGIHVAVVETFAAKSDETGKLSIQFISVTDNAKVSAIEVAPLFSGNYTAKPAILPGQGGDAPVGPFLNGKLPSANPSQISAAGGWTAVPAFPNLAGAFWDVMDILPVPLTTPAQVVVRERRGVVTIFDETPDIVKAQTKVFIDISDRVSTNHNGGISGLAFHPDFNKPDSPNKDYVYVYYQTIQASVMFNRLSRFTRNPQTGVVDNATEMVMIQQRDLPPFDHTGGGMLFDKDGFLVLAIGDLEWTDEKYDEVFTVDKMFQSSVIRIDVNQDPVKSFAPERTLQQSLPSNAKYGGAGNFSGVGYFIPKDNPYNQVPNALQEHYAKGVRNPWNMSLDAQTGDIYMFDAGSNVGPMYEEINLLKSKADYGWPYWEGPVSKTYETGIAKPDAGKEPGIFTLDYWSYDHDNGNGNAIADGFVYRGTAFPELAGKMIYADFGSGRIWALENKSGVKTNTLLFDGDAGIAGIDPSGDGETIYVVYYTTGQIYKLKSVGVPNPPPPSLLSQTGVFTDLATLTPAPGLIPVSPASPLWSDGASKHRWIAVPNDGVRDSAAEKIQFSENDEWSFPVGSVFIKHFELPFDQNNPKSVYRLETRFLVHGQDGYFAFTYRWNDSGTEAYLADEGSTATIAVTKPGGSVVNQVWQFPSKAACLDCHQSASGRVLGIKTRSLNWQYPYASLGLQNQLTYLNSTGMFNQALDPATFGSFVTAKGLGDSSASVEWRVRSYLDMNCSHCHRPGSVSGRAIFDARLTTSLELAQLLNETPHADLLGIASAKIIKPGDVNTSILAIRDSSRNPAVQMPPLGTTIVDSHYLSLLTTWISRMGTDGALDSDGDSVSDVDDAFPNNVAEWADTDGDGVGDNSDAFPTNPLETKDSDGDGIGDNTPLGARLKVLSLNSGGGAVGTFAADESFTGGTAVTNAEVITGVPTGLVPDCFKSERQGNFTYTFSGLIPSIFHRVQLYFAETEATSSGQRIFKVSVNGEVVLDNFDIFVAAGGAKKAIMKEVTRKPAADGKITIQFTGITGAAKVNAIAVVKHLAVSATDTDGDGVSNSKDAFPSDPSEWADSNGDGAGDNLRLGASKVIRSLNAGGPASGTFAKDSDFSGGSTSAVSSLTVTGVPTGAPAAIYRSERNGNFTYTFSGLATNTYHRIDLHFVEIAVTAAKLRKFDVFINGRLTLDDFDIFAAASGQRKAIAKTLYARTDSAGKIAIRFAGVVGKAKVNGISLFKQNVITVYDSDGDGVPDSQDALPANPLESKDTDGDGVGDNSDAFPADPLEWKDSNGDGVGDNTPLGALQRINAINCGGVTSGIFLKDANFSGGLQYAKTATVTGVPAGVAAAIYRSERSGNFSYTFSGLDLASYHRIELYFAETLYTAAGKRKFDVFINGKLVADDLDIFAAAGGSMKALTRVRALKPDSTGKIVIRFVSVVGPAKVNGIALFKHLPVVAPKSAPGLKGESLLKVTEVIDTDGDGVPDNVDAFPNDPTESADSDKDGMGDNNDLFPADPLNTGAGKYTLLLPVPNGVGGIGTGYGILTLDAKLSGEISFVMGDGTLFSQTVKVVNRTLTVNATSSKVDAPDTFKGSLTWISQPGISDLQGTLQWTIPGLPVVDIQAIGSRYTPGTLQTQVGAIDATIDLIGQSVDVKADGQITTNSLAWGLSQETGTFDSATGLLVWQVTLPQGKAITIRAAYFSVQKVLGGYYDDGAGESGEVQIVPR